MPSAAYSVQLEDLASHGYVVVAIDHPNDSPLLVVSDGTFIPFDKKTWSEHQPPGPPTADGMKFGVLRQEDWIRDSGFVLEELRSQSNTPFFSALDPSRVGAFGHSMGGTVAARLCQSNNAVRACMDEDGELIGHTLTPGEVIPAIDPTVAVKKPLLIMRLVEPSMKPIPEYMQVRQASRAELVRFLNMRTSQSYLAEMTRPLTAARTLSSQATFARSVVVLRRNAVWRAITLSCCKSERVLMRLSAMPWQRYSRSGSPLEFSKGKAASELTGAWRATLVADAMNR